MQRVSAMVAMTAFDRPGSPASALHRIEVTSSTSNGDGFQIENTRRAERCGRRVVEIPITFTDRTLRESKMSGSIVREALTQVLTWRLRELRACFLPASRSQVPSSAR